MRLDEIENSGSQKSVRLDSVETKPTRLDALDETQQNAIRLDEVEQKPFMRAGSNALDFILGGGTGLGFSIGETPEAREVAGEKITAAKSAAWRTSEAFYRTPKLIYDALYYPYNKEAEISNRYFGTNLPEAKAPEWMTNNWFLNVSKAGVQANNANKKYTQYTPDEVNNYIQETFSKTGKYPSDKEIETLITSGKDNFVTLVKKGKLADAIDFGVNEAIANAPYMLASAAMNAAGLSIPQVMAGLGLYATAGAGRDIEQSDTPLNETQAFEAQALLGMSEAVFEALGTGAYFKYVDDLFRITGSKIGKEVVKRSVVNSILPYVKAAGMGFLENGIEEAATAGAQGLISKWYGLKDELTIKQIVMDMMNEGLLGGFIGTVYQAPLAVISKLSTGLNENTKEMITGEKPKTELPSREELVATVTIINNINKGIGTEAKTLTADHIQLEAIANSMIQKEQFSETEARNFQENVAPEIVSAIDNEVANLEKNEQQNIQDLIESKGMRYDGIQYDKNKQPVYAVFTDPAHGSTMMMKLNEITSESLDEKIKNKKIQMGVPVADQSLIEEEKKYVSAEEFFKKHKIPYKKDFISLYENAIKAGMNLERIFDFKKYPEGYKESTPQERHVYHALISADKENTAEGYFNVGLEKLKKTKFENRDLVMANMINELSKAHEPEKMIIEEKEEKEAKYDKGAGLTASFGREKFNQEKYNKALQLGREEIAKIIAYPNKSMNDDYPSARLFEKINTAYGAMPDNHFLMESANDFDDLYTNHIIQDLRDELFNNPSRIMELSKQYREMFSLEIQRKIDMLQDEIDLAPEKGEEKEPKSIFDLFQQTKREIEKENTPKIKALEKELTDIWNKAHEKKKPTTPIAKAISENFSNLENIPVFESLDDAEVYGETIAGNKDAIAELKDASMSLGEAIQKMKQFPRTDDNETRIKKLAKLQEAYNLAIKKAGAPPIKPPDTLTTEGMEEPDENPVPKKEGAENLSPDEQSLNDAFQKQKDVYFGERDTRILDTKVEKRLLQKELLSILGKKKYDNDAIDIDKAMQLYIDSKQNPEHAQQTSEMYEKLTDEQKRIVDLSQNLPDEVKALADKMQESYRALGLEALDQGVIRNVLDNYVGRIWKLDDKQTTELYRKFGTKTRHAKQRIFETIIEGMAVGYTLKVEGATNNLQILKEELIRTITNKNFMDSLMRVKTLEGQPLLSTKQLEGYKRVENPGFKKWKWVGKVEEGEIYGKNSFIDEEGNLFERQELYAPENVAASLNNIFGVSKLKGIKPLDFITKWNAITKSWILQSSLFHHLAFMRSYYFGTGKKRFSEMNVSDAYKEGIRAIEQNDPIIRLGVKNGLTLGLKQDWNEELLQEKTGIGKTLDKLGVTKAIKDKLLELRERQASFLFGEFGAGLKAKAFTIELRNHMKKYPNLTADEAAKHVANLINDDFGGLHLERMERNPTVQHIFRLFMLAPDWTESNIRTMIKAVKAGSKEETQMYRKFWAGILTKGAFLTIVANLLMAAWDSDDKDAVSILDTFLNNLERQLQEGKLRWTSVDITPIYKMFGGETERRKYFSLLGHFTDPMKFIIHPLQSAKHKGSVVFNFFYDALTGTDWSGRRYTTWQELLGTDKEKGYYKTSKKGKYKKGDPKFGKLQGQTVTWDFKGGKPLQYGQIPSFLLNQLKGSQPVQFQNLMSFLNGEMEGFDALANSLGLGVRTTYED